MEASHSSATAASQQSNSRTTNGGSSSSTVQRVASGPIKPALPMVRLQTMERLLHQFRHVAGKSGFMCEKDFKKAADIRSDYFASHLFKAIDKDRNGKITCDEFVNFMYTLECQDVQGRLRILFNMYDTDGKGVVTLDELIQLLLASVQESNSQMEVELVEHLAMCIMDTFDVDGDGEISFEEFVEATSQYPELLVGLTVVGLGSESSKKGLGLLKGVTSTLTEGYKTVINNPQRTLWIAILILALMGAFVWRAYQYSSGPKCRLMSWTLPLAKGCGQMIKVTTTLILLPVSRTTMTRLRETPLRHIIPFDDAIAFHILLGTLGFIFAWIHALAHIHDLLRWGNPNLLYQFHEAFPDVLKQPTHFELWTSLVAITGLTQLISYTLVFLTASNWPRRAPWMVNTRLGKWLNDFKLIWRVHHLTAVYLSSLLFHPFPHIPDEANEWGYSDVWAWIGIPVLIYVLERIARLYRQARDVHILCAELLPGKVLALKLSKPKGFEYESGMYVYVNCPRLAKSEWHPFSLTSAPGADHLSLHIRVAGDWTEELYNRFQSYERTQRNEEFQAKYMMSILPKLGSMARFPQADSVHVTIGKQAGVDSVSPRLWNGLPLVKDSTRIERKASTTMKASQSGILDIHVVGTSPKEMARQLSAPSSIAFLPHGSCGEIKLKMAKDEPVVAVPVSINPLWLDDAEDEGDGDATDDLKVIHLHSYNSNEVQAVRGARDLPIGRQSLRTDEPKKKNTGISLTPFAMAAGSSGTQPCGAGPKQIADGDVREEMTPKSMQPVSHTSNYSFATDLAHVKNRELNSMTELPVKLLLDGPFGAPAQGYRDYSVLLLVGAGIGVTPFASVLSDLVHRMGQMARGAKPGQISMMPHFKKVYFYWSVRSQSEVVWFSRVLEAISRGDVHKLLDINVHITGLRSANDVRTMPLKLVQVAVHKKTGMDVMSGLNGHVLTRFGRPDWAKVFRDLQRKHRGEKKVGVFYSGPNTLAAVLRRLSHQYSTRGNKFIFVKESFGYW